MSDEQIIRLARRPIGFKVSRSSKDKALREACTALAKRGDLIGKPYDGGMIWFATH